MTRLHYVLGWLALLALGCGEGTGGSRDAQARNDTTRVQETEAASDAHTDADGPHSDAEGEPKRVTLSELSARTARVRTDTVSRQPIGEAGLVVPGQVQFDPRRVALISPRAAGRIERLGVVEGDRVRAGQIIASLYSPPFLTAQSDFLQATRRAGLLAGSPDSAGAAAVADAARLRLRLLGLEDAAVARLAESGKPLDYLPVTSPLGGTITKAHVLPGAAVESGSPMFEVADLSVMDVAAEVPEQSLPLVRIGQRAQVTIAAYPNLTFAGRIERLHGELDPETRTIEAVAHVPNSGGRLRAGMFATVRLATGGAAPAGTAESMPTISEAAVVTEGERRFVFVEVGTRTYERREVDIGPLTAPGSMTPVQGRVGVRNGLAPGERIVVEGAFTLKSELAKARLDDHGH
ncbi:MAG: efflux RND transporter periplasmic adaptor subunit [Gemmatimonadota bacterium]|nr:efflux RND transporter periplasmic adaptor subunit [Gemmatimonadota bacterium]